MKPDEVAVRLRTIAALVDSSGAPSRWEVAYALRGVLAALDDLHPRSKKTPTRPPPPKGQGGFDPSAAPPPPKLPGAMVDRTKGKPGYDKNWVGEEDRRLKKLDRQLDREKSQMPEYASLQAFVSFLDDEERDSFTVPERKKFCELNKLPTAVFDEAMAAADKHMVRALPADKIKAPAQVIEKAAREMGVTVAEVRKFLNTAEGAGEITDTRALVDAMNDWLAG